MADVVVFHHAQGLTSGIHAFADDLRAAGHVVSTPDLYDGAVFDTLDAGIAHAQQISFPALIERGERAVADQPAGAVYAGFSLGVLPAQYLAQTRAGALGAVLLHSCLPAAEFGTSWPAGVPAQIHAMDRDPFFVDEGDIEAARELVASTKDVELFLYPGEQHLFADRSLASYDPASAAALTERVLAFLAALER
jgi:dienelactone hydrolase